MTDEGFTITIERIGGTTRAEKIMFVIVMTFSIIFTIVMYIKNIGGLE